MFKLKRLYVFILKSFIPVFLMTFFICLFILVMQFMWRYIDELVGKGLSLRVLAEFFFYAASSLVPMALPLAILLASLMTFGNFGERVELTAMKAAGINLLKIMKPLIVLICFVCVFAFYFQNTLMPKIQVKLWTLLFSMRQKSPELDIPENVFYHQIQGINIYVTKKNPATGMLYDVMFYNFSDGFDNAAVIVADSARLDMSDDKKYLLMTMYHGEGFENLKNQRTAYQNVPYRRENFAVKRMLVEFDANFTRMDESLFQGQYISQNIDQLGRSIDSMKIRTDSLKRINTAELKMFRIMGENTYQREDRLSQELSQSAVLKSDVHYNVDSTLLTLSKVDMTSTIENAIRKAQGVKDNFEFRGIVYTDQEGLLHRFEIEWHTKFTLSFACFIFFFIGAPLGAIIRKGGLGIPIILSVLLFIFYYIINNTGYKMARDGVWDAYIGMWFSSAVLLPMGVFLTYKATSDSSIMNGDTYINFFKTLIPKYRKRTLSKRELVLYDPDLKVVAEDLNTLNRDIDLFIVQSQTHYQYKDFYIEMHRDITAQALRERLESMILQLSETTSSKLIAHLNQYPMFIRMHPIQPITHQKLFNFCRWFYPLGALVWLRAIYYTRKRVLLFEKVKANNIEIIRWINQQ